MFSVDVSHRLHHDVYDVCCIFHWHCLWPCHVWVFFRSWKQHLVKRGKPQLTNKTKPHLGLHILLISQFFVLQNSRNKHRGKQTKAKKKKVHHCLPTISGTMLREWILQIRWGSSCRVPRKKTKTKKNTHFNFFTFLCLQQFKGKYLDIFNRLIAVLTDGKKSLYYIQRGPFALLPSLIVKKVLHRFTC